MNGKLLLASAMKFLRLCKNDPKDMESWRVSKQTFPKRLASDLLTFEVFLTESYF